MAVVAAVLFLALGFLFDWTTALGFLLGAFTSALAGYIGMNVSVRSNSKTTEAARRGLSPALALAFRAGSVTGLLVVALGLLSVATDPGAFKNPSMTIEVSARGKRLDERGASERVELTIKKEIKIATVLTLSSRLSYNDGPFSSTGPIPPRVGEATTYTVTWSLSNTSNGVANTKVSAVLPSYVTWLGEISPVSEELSYKALGGELVWNAGEAEAGEGVGSPPREVSFQISILPSLSQVGTSPTLIGEAAARGTDRFTGVEVKSNARQALSTASLSDPGTSPKSGIVTK